MSPAAPPEGFSVASPLDRLILRGLVARGRHGVLEAERVLGQIFVIDLTLRLDTRAAAQNDDLRRTVDYGVLAQRVVQLVEGEPVALIETLAQRIADLALSEAGVDEVEVTVHKPQAPVPVAFSDVAVTVVRRATQATPEQRVGES